MAAAALVLSANSTHASVTGLTLGVAVRGVSGIQCRAPLEMDICGARTRSFPWTTGFVVGITDAVVARNDGRTRLHVPGTLAAVRPRAQLTGRAALLVRRLGLASVAHSKVRRPKKRHVGKIQMISVPAEAAHGAVMMPTGLLADAVARGAARTAGVHVGQHVSGIASGVPQFHSRCSVINAPEVVEGPKWRKWHRGRSGFEVLYMDRSISVLVTSAP